MMYIVAGKWEFACYLLYQDDRHLAHLQPDCPLHPDDHPHLHGHPQAVSIYYNLMHTILDWLTRLMLTNVIIVTISSDITMLVMAYKQCPSITNRKYFKYLWPDIIFFSEILLLTFLLYNIHLHIHHQLMFFSFLLFFLFPV